LLVGFPDQGGEETCLLDAVLLPELQRDGVEALEQRRQPAGHAAIDAHFVDHRTHSLRSCSSRWRERVVATNGKCVKGLHFGLTIAAGDKRVPNDTPAQTEASPIRGRGFRKMGAASKRCEITWTAEKAVHSVGKQLWQWPTGHQDAAIEFGTCGRYV